MPQREAVPGPLYRGPGTGRAPIVALVALGGILFLAGCGLGSRPPEGGTVVPPLGESAQQIHDLARATDRLTQDTDAKLRTCFKDEGLGELGDLLFRPGRQRSFQHLVAVGSDELGPSSQDAATQGFVGSTIQAQAPEPEPSDSDPRFLAVLDRCDTRASSSRSAAEIGDAVELLNDARSGALAAAEPVVDREVQSVVACVQDEIPTFSDEFAGSDLESAMRASGLEPGPVEDAESTTRTVNGVPVSIYTRAESYRPSAEEVAAAETWARCSLQTECVPKVQIAFNSGLDAWAAKHIDQVRAASEGIAVATEGK